jgi:uncharacterized protein (TIGR04222 family)
MDTATLPQDTLADRLRAFRFESPDAPRFVDELARETGWPPARAHRVAEEYRRFLWIAGTTSDLVSPSPDVDQAWHLHLLDTRSYWEELCPKILGRALHHERGRGGLVRSKSLDQAYRRTLAAYRAAFGEPPADVWPAPPDGLAEPTAGNESRGGRRIGRLALVAVAAALAVGAALARRELAQAFFSLSDVWFLVGVCGLVALMTLYASPVRRRALQPDDAPSEAELAALDPYDLGYLTNGPRGALGVALTELVASGTLVVDADARGVRPTDGADGRPPDTALQRLVLASVRARPRGHIDDQLPSRRQVQALVEPALIAGGFLVSAGSRAAVDALTFGTPVAALAAILLRCALVARPSPVLGLSFVMLPLVAALVTLPFVGPSPATGRGALALARLKARFSLPPPSTRVDEDFGALVALFGPSALRASTLEPLADLLTPPPSATPGCGGCGG